MEVVSVCILIQRRNMLVDGVLRLRFLLRRRLILIRAAVLCRRPPPVFLLLQLPLQGQEVVVMMDGLCIMYQRRIMVLRQEQCRVSHDSSISSNVLHHTIILPSRQQCNYHLQVVAAIVVLLLLLDINIINILLCRHVKSNHHHHLQIRMSRYQDIFSWKKGRSYDTTIRRYRTSNC